MHLLHEFTGTVMGGAIHWPFPTMAWKYSWRRGLTQLQRVFPLSGSRK